METSGWLEKMDQLGNQLEPLFANQVFKCREFGLERDFSIARFQDDSSIIARLNAAISAQRGGKVYG